MRAGAGAAAPGGTGICARAVDAARAAASARPRAMAAFAELILKCILNFTAIKYQTAEARVNGFVSGHSSRRATARPPRKKLAAPRSGSTIVGPWRSPARRRHEALLWTSTTYFGEGLPWSFLHQMVHGVPDRDRRLQHADRIDVAAAPGGHVQVPLEPDRRSVRAPADLGLGDAGDPGARDAGGRGVSRQRQHGRCSGRRWGRWRSCTPPTTSPATASTCRRSTGTTRRCSRGPASAPTVSR